MFLFFTDYILQSPWYYFKLSTLAVQCGPPLLQWRLSAVSWYSSSYKIFEDLATVQSIYQTSWLTMPMRLP